MNSFINIRKDFNPEHNWWELNPHMIHVRPFSKLYSEDTSKDKHISSKHMWCVYFMSEPDELINLYYRLPEDERFETCKQYNPEFDPEQETIADCLEQYPDVCLTLIEQTLKNTKDMFHKRNAFLKKADYNFETMTQLDNAIAKTPKLEEDFDKVYQKYLEQQNKKVQLHGGRNQTLREKKLIRPDLAFDDDDQ